MNKNFLLVWVLLLLTSVIAVLTLSSYTISSTLSSLVFEGHRRLALSFSKVIVSSVKSNLMMNDYLSAQYLLSSIADREFIKNVNVIHEDEIVIDLQEDEVLNGKDIVIVNDITFSPSGEKWGELKLVFNGEYYDNIRTKIDEGVKRLYYAIALVLLLIISIFTLVIFFSSEYLRKRVATLASNMKGFMPNPIERIVWSDLVTLLNNSALDIVEFQKKISSHQRLKNEEKLIRRIFHDVRTPVAALKSMASMSNSLSDNDRRSLNRIINSLLSITEGLFNKGQNSKLLKYDLINTIDDILSEIRLKFHSQAIEFVITSPREVIILNGDKTEFSRHLSNLLNNSVEAGAKKVHIKIQRLEAKKEYKIQLYDDGKGIPVNILEQIRNGVSITFGKKNGSGLGLFYAKKYFEDEYGTFNVVSALNIGTEIDFNISVVDIIDMSNEKLKVILLEDDFFIRKSWEIDAVKCGVDLSCFESYISLKDALDDFPLDSIFYLDKNLNDESDIIDIVKYLRSKGFENLFLSTSERLESVESELSRKFKCLYEKSPPFLSIFKLSN